MSFIAGQKNKSPTTYPEGKGPSLSSLSEGNYVSIVNAVPSPVAPLSASVGLTVAAIIIKPIASGIFRVNVDMGWFDTTTGEAVTWSLLGATAAVPATAITMSGSTAAAIIGSSADATAQGLIVTSRPSVISNAGTPHTLASKASVSIAGPTPNQPQNFDVNGIFSNAGAGTTKVPFTLGADCIFYLQVAAALGTIEDMVLQFSVQELPLV